jgi:hypothetical protein
LSPRSMSTQKSFTKKVVQQPDIEGKERQAVCSGDQWHEGSRKERQHCLNLNVLLNLVPSLAGDAAGIISPRNAL